MVSKEKANIGIGNMIETNMMETFMSETFTYPLDVDLEWVECIGAVRAHILLIEVDTLLLEEVLNCRLRYLAIVSQSVGFQSSYHVVVVVMGSLQGLLWLFHYSLDQLTIITLQYDAARWEDGIILHILVKVLLSILVIIFWLIVILDWVSIFIQHDRLVQEDMLGALESTWESIQNVTSIAAVILLQLQFQNSVEQVVRHSDRSQINLNLRPSLLRCIQILSLLVDSIFFLLSLLLDLGPTIIDQLVLTSGLFINGGHA